MTKESEWGEDRLRGRGSPIETKRICIKEGGLQ